MRTAKYKAGNPTFYLDEKKERWFENGYPNAGWCEADADAFFKQGAWIETTNDPPPTIEETPGNNAKLTVVQCLIVAACGDLQKTLLSKNQDYGDSVFNSPVMAPGLDAGLAIRVRMSDKISRINNLRKSKVFLYDIGGEAKARDHLKDHQEAVNESLADTWLDLAGYALLEYVRITRKDA